MAEKREIQIIDILREAYPDARCELRFGSPFELLVAVMLSAQCTDKRVNEVTKTLFEIANTPEDFVSMGQPELEKLIFSCGLYHNKAKNIISASKDISEKFGGRVPGTFEGLMSLSGVGRKMANVVMNEAFGADTIAVDTHVFRVSRRLGLSEGKTSFEVETDLDKLFEGYQKKRGIHHLLIFHGRYCCKSLKPGCAGCPVNFLCGKKVN